MQKASKDKIRFAENIKVLQTLPIGDKKVKLLVTCDHESLRKISFQTRSPASNKEFQKERQKSEIGELMT